RFFADPRQDRRPTGARHQPSPTPSAPSLSVSESRREGRDLSSREAGDGGLRALPRQRRRNRKDVAGRGRLRTAEAPTEPIHPRAPVDANPQRPTIGVAEFDRVDLLGIDSATNGTTRTVRDLDMSPGIEPADFADDRRTPDQQPIPLLG